jgi:hypothetical protein
MDVEVIRQYQLWAERRYVSPLSCKNHVYHHLLPIQTSGVKLICPRGDYERDLGLAEYLEIKRKIAMVEYLWQQR